MMFRAIIRSMLARERMEVQGWSPPWLRHQHEARYDWARQYCRGESVLDAACGTGYGSRRLAQTARRVVSLDIALDAVADARRTSPGVKAVLGDATHLPFPDASFGVFVSFETIEHIPDDKTYVAEARRILVPGGTFVCSTPNRLLVNPGNTISDRPFNPFHVREYSAAELDSVLRTAFGSVEMLGQSVYSDGYARLLGAVGRRSKKAGVRLHQLRKLAGMPLERRSRHEPVSPLPRNEPEVLLAICR
jgi:ubiquinone/menaquinone biosynthesis C-methylase UbiE